MGLTKSSVGGGAYDKGLWFERKEGDIVIALAGNPNVGKSTVFNSLTGLHQHTGNWAGKTVANASGRTKVGDQNYIFVDIPGTYSLNANSPEEVLARDFICSGDADFVVVVCDATCLLRSLRLVLEIKELTNRVVVCVNLIDEAKKKGICIDIPLLSELLALPVVSTEARIGKGVSHIINAIKNFSPKDETPSLTEDLSRKAKEIYTSVTIGSTNLPEAPCFFDKLLTNKFFAFPIMLFGLCFILWLTIIGANYPSAFLSKLLFSFEAPLHSFLLLINLPELVCDALTFGVWRTLSWVTSVMLPPMAIFFPLFTFLEDFGFLPRIAFNLDRTFEKCSACGKQALTMCMGFGCNAAGVVGARIIDSPRERLIAILTNSLVPCNGKFPGLIAIISIFFISAGGNLKGAFFLTFFITLGISLTLLSSKLLSITVLRGKPSLFTLELPPYRRPQLGKVIIRSILDRTLFILGRAALVSAPCGLLIWIMANINIGEVSLFYSVSAFLDPFGNLLGLSGVILFAFILGFPANEIVLPICLMTYTGGNSLLDISDTTSLSAILSANGWSITTAVSFIFFSLFHWPCGTTLLTIKKETGSIKWALVAAVLPTVFGILFCFVFTLLTKLI